MPEHLVAKARLVAQVAHNAVGQKRKYTGEPYWYHCDEVAERVRSVEGTPEMIAAAYLHDVLEDTHLTADDLRRLFGGYVTDLVVELTDHFADPALGNRAKRKQMERERLAGNSPMAQTIKLADVLDNGHDIADHDPHFAKVYIREIGALLDVMTRGDPELYAEARQMVEAYEGSK